MCAYEVEATRLIASCHTHFFGERERERNHALALKISSLELQNNWFRIRVIDWSDVVQACHFVSDKNKLSAKNQSRFCGQCPQKISRKVETHTHMDSNQHIQD